VIPAADPVVPATPTALQGNITAEQVFYLRIPPCVWIPEVKSLLFTLPITAEQLSKDITNCLRLGASTAQVHIDMI